MWSSLVVRMPDQAREPLHISRKSRFSVIRADRLGGRGIEFVGGRANACLHRSAYHLILDPDRFEALLGDASGPRFFGLDKPSSEMRPCRKRARLRLR